MRKFLFAVLLIMLGGLSQPRAKAESFDEKRQSNWHQWRGPGNNGVSKTATPPVEWNEGKNVQWKVAIDGNGSSAPIIWEDKIFLLTSVNTGEIDPTLPKPEDQPKRVFGITHPNTSYDFFVLCLDQNSGKEIWRQKATSRIPHEGHHGDNNFASASPFTDGQRLYCWFGSAGLYCYDLNGKKLWARDLGKVYMGASLGEGTSPVVQDGKLVIVRDHKGQSYIEVMDAATGKTLWKKNRDESNTWATPAIVKFDGKYQVITTGTNKIRSYYLSNGEIVWQCGGLTNNAIPCPVVENDVVYCMTGYKGYSLLAIPLSSKGDVTDSGNIIWQADKGTPYVPSPVLYDGQLFFTQSNQAILTSLDAKTGETMIERTRLPAMGNVYSSPVGAADRVYITSRNGNTLVIQKSGEFKVLAANKLDDTFNSSPAIVGNQLFLRGRRFLYSIAEKSDE